MVDVKVNRRQKINQGFHAKYFCDEAIQCEFRKIG
jgi:hypothetical protein